MKQASKEIEKILELESDLDFIKKSDDYYSDARKKRLKNGRILVWFSCGVTSAVAAKLAVNKYKNTKEVHVVYCDTGGEHPSNKVFLERVQNWLGIRIKILKNPKYEDHWDVFRKRKFLVSPKGAVCTTELKKQMRREYEDFEKDIQIFGYSLEEEVRAMKFRSNNPEVYLECPLIDNGLDKGDCLNIIQELGIELPFLYQPQKSGSPYSHNNCLPCVKGGAFYWNKIRVDFPDMFQKMVDLEEELGLNFIRHKGKYINLKDLPEDAGIERKQPNMECSLFCGNVLDDFQEDE